MHIELTSFSHNISNKVMVFVRQMGSEVYGCLRAIGPLVKFLPWVQISGYYEEYIPTS